MRTASLLVPAAALLAAAPAFATSTIHCTAPGRAGLELFISVGNGPPPDGGIVGLRVVENGRETVIGAARLASRMVTPHALRFDIGTLGSLSARTGRGPAYKGRLRWHGRTGPVRCLWDEDE